MSDNGAPQQGTPEPPETGATPPNPTDQQDTGGQATDRDAAVAAANSEAAKYRRQLREKETELEKLRLANATDAERAVAAARAEGAAQFEHKWRQAVLDNAALSALAEKGVTAAEPALRSLDLRDIEIDENGRVDAGAIKARVEDLLTRYPMFMPSGPPTLPTLNGDNQHGPTSGRLRPAAPDQSENLLRYGLGG